MIRGRCPICSREFAIQALDDLPSFPFCSDRCRLVDLGRWIDGSYALPDGGTEPPSLDDEEEGESTGASGTPSDS
jgi:endogenous inhibitor of DNA gyrase (YacG/DUF329 family)